MATIPIGQGRRVAPGRATPTSTGEAIGVDSGRALQQFGQAAFNAGITDIELDAQERRRQQATAQAARRQDDLLTMQESQDALRRMHDEVADGVNDGSLAKDGASKSWDERSTGLIADTVAKIHPSSQKAVQRQLASLSSQLGTSVRRVVEKRDQSDIRAGIDQTLEYQSRQYASDPAKASQMVNETLAALGPYSGWTQQELQAKGQKWREDSQFTRAYSAISAGRNSRDGLSQAEQLVRGDGLPDLDPQKRATLQDRIDAYRMHLDQKDEMAAQRRQRELETRLKNAEATFNVFQTMADKGTMLDPSYIDTALQVTAGTPYQAPIKALAQQAKDNGGLAAQPLPVQRQLLTQINAEIAQKGISPALDKRRTQIEKVLHGSEQDLKDDPLQAGLQRGVITALPPLDIARGGVVGLVQQLDDRVQQAARVSTWAGRPVAPMTVDEARQTSDMIKAMPADQRASAVQMLAARMPAQQAQALAGMMFDNQGNHDESNKALAVAFALGGARTTFDRPTAELVFKGAEALKNKTIKEDKNAVDGWQGRINAKLAGIYGNPQQTELVSAAARYVLAGKVVEGASGGDGDVESAINLAVGGRVADVNGAQVVIPAGVERKDFDMRIRQYPVAELQQQLPDGKVYVRGQPMDAAQFAASLPSAQLRTVGRGRYAVVGSGSVILNSQAQPVVISLTPQSTPKVEAPSAR